MEENHLPALLKPDHRYFTPTLVLNVTYRLAVVRLRKCDCEGKFVGVILRRGTIRTEGGEGWNLRERGREGWRGGEGGRE